MYLFISTSIITTFFLTFLYRNFFSIINDISVATSKSYLKTIQTILFAQLMKLKSSICIRDSVKINKINKNIFCIECILETKKCNLFVKMIRGPQNDFIILNNNEVNVTDKIKPFLHYHFNVIKPTPLLLGETQLRIQEEKFDENDILELN